MRTIAILPLFLLVLLSASARPAASACPPELCRCRDATSHGLSNEAFVAQHRDRAEWVALARVTRIDTLAAMLIPGRRDSLMTRAIVARLAVSRTWKGEVRDSQVVQLSTTAWRSSCDLAFTAGESYVVFASRGDGGQLRTTQCVGTVPLRDAAGTLEVLGAGQRSLRNSQSLPEPTGPVRPIIVVDGRVYDGVADSTTIRERMQAIDPNDIESLEVMKPVHAIERFGPQARHGAVIIWMQGAGGKCLSSTRLFDEPVASARSIATPAFGFTGVDSASIAVVQDAWLCRDVSWLLGKVEPGPPFDGAPRPTYADVVVVRIGREGYLVHSPWHSARAGKFACDKAIVRRDLKSVNWLCS